MNPKIAFRLGYSERGGMLGSYTECLIPEVIGSVHL